MSPIPGEILTLLCTKHAISSLGLFRCESVAVAAPAYIQDKPWASYLSHTMLPRSGAVFFFFFLLKFLCYNELWPWTSQKSHRENLVLQYVDSLRQARKTSKERGRLQRNTSTFHSFGVGSPFKYYCEIKQKQIWLLFHSLGTNASCVTRIVLSTPKTAVLERRKKIPL